MDVHKEKIQSDGSIYRLELIIVVRGDLQNKEIIGDTWYITASTRNLKYFLEYEYNNKSRVQKLYFVGEFLHANVKHRFCVKLDSRYG